jgi:hypothetical protein
VPINADGYEVEPTVTITLPESLAGELIAAVTYRPWADAMTSEFLHTIQAELHKAGGPALWRRFQNRGENARISSNLQT